MQPGAAVKERLSRVYLDDYPITLMGDEATPPLSRVIRAGGKHPNRVDVLYLTSPADKVGRAVGPEEVIDRTAEPTRPIYLRTVLKDADAIFTAQAKPVLTADAERVLSGPDAPSGLTPWAPMPNLDPVISQLGGAKPREASHEEGVFRAPSQLPLRGPASPSNASPVPALADASAAAPVRVAALEKAARLLKAAAAKARQAQESQAQATAEGEARVVPSGKGDGT